MMAALISDLEKRVNEALLNDPRTKDAIVEVIHQYGILTLRGSVDSNATREAVEEVARQHGEVPVMNELRVQ
jgi:osmotically-inducible protein OsmY